MSEKPQYIPDEERERLEKIMAEEMKQAIGRPAAAETPTAELNPPNFEIIPDEALQEQELPEGIIVEEPVPVEDSLPEGEIIENEPEPLPLTVKGLIKRPNLTADALNQAMFDKIIDAQKVRRATQSGYENVIPLNKVRTAQKTKKIPDLKGLADDDIGETFHQFLDQAEYSQNAQEILGATEINADNADSLIVAANSLENIREKIQAAKAEITSEMLLTYVNNRIEARLGKDKKISKVADLDAKEFPAEEAKKIKADLAAPAKKDQDLSREEKIRIDAALLTDTRAAGFFQLERTLKNGKTTTRAMTLEEYDRMNSFVDQVLKYKKSLEVADKKMA
jgi:hypothetical protein